jgi:hypothetical protein
LIAFPEFTHPYIPMVCAALALHHGKQVPSRESVRWGKEGAPAHFTSWAPVLARLRVARFKLQVSGSRALGCNEC